MKAWLLLWCSSALAFLMIVIVITQRTCWAQGFTLKKLLSVQTTVWGNFVHFCLFLKWQFLHQIRNEKSLKLVNRVQLIVYAPWTYLGLPFSRNRKPTAYSSCFEETVTHSRSKNILEFINCQQINGRKYVKRFCHTPSVYPYQPISLD